jgi:hypothetical protein
MGTPLLDRINARNHDPLCGLEGTLCPTCENAPWEPWNDEPPKRPAWLERLTDQDRTGTIKVQR